MRIISRYVVVDTLRVAAMALLVFTAIFFVAASIRAAGEGINLPQFLRVTPFIALYVIRFTLPISLLVGVTFTLGRLTADREILALRACGVHFMSIAAPLLALGIALSAGLYVFNDRALPVCDYARRNILKSFAREILTLQKGRNKSFGLPGYTVFCTEYDGNMLKGLMIFRDDPDLPFEIAAREGRVWLSKDKLHIVIALKDVRITYYGTKDKVSYGELVSENYSIFVPMRQRTKDRPEFLTISELKKQIRGMQKQIDEITSGAAAFAGPEEKARTMHKLTYLKRKAEIEYHRRGADALNPFLFLLIGTPIPLLLRSRTKLVPTFAALMTVMLTSHAVGLGAESFAETGRLDPWFAIWLGDIVTAFVGVFLLWKLFEK